MICQHYPCDPDCCPGLDCDRDATVEVNYWGRSVGHFCEEHARQYNFEDEPDFAESP